MKKRQKKISKKQSDDQRLQLATLRASRIGFLFAGIYTISTIIYKLWKLITPEMLMQRWTISAVTFGVVLTLWWLSKAKNLPSIYYQSILALQIIMYLTIAGYSIYTERGMSSNSIILFVIPLVIVALEHNVKALFATTILAILVYTTSAIQYFRDYPSEGYKVELYGGLIFYGSVLVVISGLLWVLVNTKQTTS